MINTTSNRNKWIFSKREWLLISPALVLACSLIATVLHSESRGKVASILQPEYRAVLSSITADLLGNGNPMKIVKVKSRTGLFVEVYDAPDESGHAALIEKIELKTSKDAFFDFRGEATRLALQDIDGDNRPEILVPAFDTDLVAHIHVFRMAADTHKIEVVSN